LLSELANGTSPCLFLERLCCQVMSLVESMGQNRNREWKGDTYHGN
jgi:hypothetical protein